MQILSLHDCMYFSEELSNKSTEHQNVFNYKVVVVFASSFIINEKAKSVTIPLKKQAAS